MLSKLDFVEYRSLLPGQLELICGPMVSECEHDDHHVEMARAILRREVNIANERRLGLMEPLASATGCGLCGSSFTAADSSCDSSRATNCHICGDAVCMACIRIESSASMSDSDEATSTRCADCEHAAVTGKRMIKLQPPGGSDAAKRFALRALFDERADSKSLVDERGFVELCKAAIRHPLVVDRRSLEREARHVGSGSSIPLDLVELSRRFQEIGSLSIDFEAARALLIDACVPPWPSRALPAHAIRDSTDFDDSDDSAVADEAKSLTNNTAIDRETTAVEEPRDKVVAAAERTWWWRSDKLPALTIKGPNARTGWGSLASLDGLARRRVWLELSDSTPRSLQYANEAGASQKVLVYLATVRQIRRDAPCVLEFRLRPSEVTERSRAQGRRLGRPPEVKRRASIVLRFETPAATSSWWSALCASRHTALAEDRAEQLGGVDRGEYDRLASGAWLNALSRIFVCGTECGGPNATPLCAPNPVGVFEGPERPFVTLSNMPEASPDAPVPRTSNANTSNTAEKNRSVGAVEQAKTNTKQQDGCVSNKAQGSEADGDGSNAMDSDDDSDDEITDEARDSSGGVELGDSLPERGFALAGPEVKAAFQALVKVIIRPPRATFDERRLGARDFAIRPPRGLSAVRADASGRGVSPPVEKTASFWATSAPAPTPSPLPHRRQSSPVVVHRDDLSVTNERGLEVRYSLWTPRLASDVISGQIDAAAEKPPCVLYVHGNACSRLGSLSLLRPLALGGVSLCSIDCAGSGNSGGEFVSLGHFERDDVAAVVDDLRRRRLVGRLALWGRSMGAATALLYASTRDPDTAAVVADSPYASLVELCRELVAKARRRGRSTANTAGQSDQKPANGARELVLSAITEAALALVRSSVKHRAGFDIFDVSPVAHIGNMRHSATPVLFLHGAKDDFVAPSHSQALNHAHGGDATLLLVPCDHQAQRPASAMLESFLFVYDRLAPKSSDRAKYAALLKALADDGYLGTRDKPEQHKNSRAADLAVQPEDLASGLDRNRQRMVECVPTVCSALTFVCAEPRSPTVLAPLCA